MGPTSAYARDAGTSAALCTVKAGRIEQENFDTYDMMRIAQMPKVEVIVMPSGGFWGGVGEPTVAVAAPPIRVSRAR